MNWKKMLELIRKGVLKEDIFSKYMDEKGDDYNQDEFTSEYTKAAKMAQAEKAEADAAKKAADQKAFDEKVKAAVDAQVKTALEALPVNARSEGVEVKENEGVWRSEMTEFLKLMAIRPQNLKTAQYERIQELSEKGFNSQKDFYYKKHGIVIDQKATNSGSYVGADANGGYWVRQEFDAEVDKLVYDESQIMQYVRVRQGDEKIAINGIQPFSYSYRTNDDTDFSKVQPVFTQDTITLKDAGAIVAAASRLLESNYYDLAGEIAELAKDAEIQLFEQQITTGDDNESDEVFDGMWFTSGISTVVAKNSGGTGAIDSADLTNAWLGCAAQTRNKGVHIMRTQEFAYLANKKDSNGVPLTDKYFARVNGQLIHIGSGRPVLITDHMEKVNGVTNKTTQPNVPYMFAVLNRFRLYRKGGRRVGYTADRYFEFDQVAWRFIVQNVQGIPTNSKSSFVAVTGLVENAVS